MIIHYLPKRASSSSPLSCISWHISIPPINYPSTYTWGYVGQFEYFLRPSLTYSSLNMSKWPYCPIEAVYKLRRLTIFWLNPHYGAFGEPFMKSITLDWFTSFFRRCSRVSTTESAGKCFKRLSPIDLRWPKSPKTVPFTKTVYGNRFKASLRSFLWDKSRARNFTPFYFNRLTNSLSASELICVSAVLFSSKTSTGWKLSNSANSSLGCSFFACWGTIASNSPASTRSTTMSTPPTNFPSRNI